MGKSQKDKLDKAVIFVKNMMQISCPLEVAIKRSADFFKVSHANLAEELGRTGNKKIPDEEECSLIIRTPEGTARITATSGGKIIKCYHVKCYEDRISMEPNEEDKEDATKPEG